MIETAAWEAWLQERERELFLDWIKQRSQRPASQPPPRGHVYLANSGIPAARPTQLLLEQLRRREAEFRELLRQPNMYGHPELLDAIRRRYELGADRQVLSTAGASAALRVVLDGLLRNAGGAARILVEAPTYEPLVTIARRLGATIDPLIRRADDGYEIQPDDVARAMRPETALLVLSNLHNPTGCFTSNERLREMIDAAQSVNPRVKVLIDETFWDFVQPRPRSAASIDPCIITVSGLTKVYGLSSIRCGWLTATEEAFELIRREWVLSDNIGCKFSESLAALAFDEIETYAEHSRQFVAAGRHVAEPALERMQAKGLVRGEAPASGCCGFVRLEDMHDADGFAESLERDEGVLVVPGRFFGPRELCGSCIRLGYGDNAEQLADGLERLERALEKARLA